jgi:hypothetical protein
MSGGNQLSYEQIDTVLLPWADRNKLVVHNNYKGDPIRVMMVPDVVRISNAGYVNPSQLWVEPLADGALKVSAAASGFGHSTTVSNLSLLDEALTSELKILRDY